MKETFRIGELSKMTGASIRTLHYYDEIGLLKPYNVTESNHRIYDITNLEQLYIILGLKELGYSLDEIKTIILKDTIYLSEYVYVQRALLEKEISSQQKKLDKLLKFEKTLADYTAIDSTLLAELLTFYRTDAQSHFTIQEFNSMRALVTEKENWKDYYSEWAKFITTLEEAYQEQFPSTHPKVIYCKTYWKKLISMTDKELPSVYEKTGYFHAEESSKDLSFGLTKELYVYLIKQMNDDS